MKKILISTGGTGGHVMPALTLYNHYKDNFETYITSDKRGLKFINTDKYPCNIIDVPHIYYQICIIYFFQGGSKGHY